MGAVLTPPTVFFAESRVRRKMVMPTIVSATTTRTHEETATMVGGGV